MTEPTITTHSTTLSLPDPSLPPLTLHLTNLNKSLVLFVGTAPGPYHIANDFACGMTVAGKSSSTAISTSARNATTLSAKLSKRYNLQIFLSLDLSAVSGRGTSEDFMLLQMEKAVVVELDRYLGFKK